MSKTFIDKACAVVPEFENRISRFDKKLRMTQCVEHIIYDYKLKMALYFVTGIRDYYHISIEDGSIIRLMHLFKLSVQ